MNNKKISPLWLILILLVILNIVNGGFINMGTWILNKILVLPAILIGLCFHEFAHGFVSDRLGDPTPKLQGRLMVNPKAHIDPFGFIALLIAGFGWGKPVEIDPRYYKHRRRDELLVALAGIIMNLLIAIVFAFIVKIILIISPGIYANAVGKIIMTILQNVIIINIVLMVFNLLPVPPLDGFNVLTEIFNLRKYDWYYSYYRFGGFLLLLLVFLNITDLFLTPMVSSIYSIIVKTIIY